MRAQLSWWAALAVGLLLQTTLLPHILTDAWSPDVTRALVLWLALMGIPRGGVWLAFAAGLAVDAASGAPLGVFAFSHLVLYMLGRPLRGKLEHSPLIFLLGPFAVWAEVLTIYPLRSLAFVNPVEFSTLAGVAMRQSLVEVVALPLVFIVMEVATGHRSGAEVTA